MFASQFIVKSGPDSVDILLRKDVSLISIVAAWIRDMVFSKTSNFTKVTAVEQGVH
jgi:hypothetical protein